LIEICALPTKKYTKICTPHAFRFFPFDIFKTTFLHECLLSVEKLSLEYIDEKKIEVPGVFIPL